MIYTINQIAERWGVESRMVKKEINKGTLKHFKIGSTEKPRYRIRQDWLEEYENGTVNQNG